MQLEKLYKINYINLCFSLNINMLAGLFIIWLPCDGFIVSLRVCTHGFPWFHANIHNLK